MRALAIATILLATSSPAMAESAANPMSAFLKAADRGDAPAMAAAMNPEKGVSPQKLLKTLDGCYLRRVYESPEKRVLAAWMCAEGADKSRVVIADVSLSDGGVVVVIELEQKNNRSAPKRTGSAFSDGEK